MYVLRVFSACVLPAFWICGLENYCYKYLSYSIVVFILFFDVQFTWYTTIAHFFSFGLLFSHHLSPLILRLTFEFSALQYTRSFLCWHLSTLSKAFSFYHCFHFVLIRMYIFAHTAHLFLPCIPCLFYFSMTSLSALIMAF